METLLNEFTGTPWALMPETFAALQTLVTRSAGDGLRAAKPAAKPALRKQDAAPNVVDGVAVIPLYGPISQRSTLLDLLGLGTSIETFRQAFRAAMRDASVKAIVLDIDSPGGSVYGVAEMAEEIAEASKTKRVVAVANSLAASAAYWLASSAGELVITPGGEAGSIGVIAAHVDISQAMDKLGIKMKLITAGKYKGEGSPYAPLDADARKNMQSAVDRYYSMFVRSVAAGRGVTAAAVREGFGQGRVLGAQAAVRAGLVDRVATLDQVVGELSGKRSAVWPAPAARYGAHHAPRLAMARRALDLM